MNDLMSPSTSELLVLFGAVLILGTLLGQWLSRTRVLPPISGYLLLGLLLGPHVFGLVEPAKWEQLQFLSDLCIGLIVYDLGRHLDWRWLQHDRSLLLTAFSDAGFTIIGAILVLLGLHFDFKSSLVIAIIVLETSPAVLVLVTQDLHARGSVTRRVLVLAALNNFIALYLLGLVLPFMHESSDAYAAALVALRHLLAPALCALAVHALHYTAARMLGKRPEIQFLLLFGSVAVAIGLAHSTGLSVPLTLLLQGMLARNINRDLCIQSVDYSRFARPFLLVLFVLVGARLHLNLSWWLLLTVLSLLVIRYIAKSIANLAVKDLSLLTSRQCLAVAATLSPMSALALAMTATVAQVEPALATTTSEVISELVAILHIVAPVLMTMSLRWVGELSGAMKEVS